MLAVNELRAFLAQARVQLQRFINYDGSLKPEAYANRSAYQHLLSTVVHDAEECREALFETAVLVDTTLFRAYMLVSPSLAGSLFRLDNFCSPNVVEEKLYETGRYADLIDFLHGKKLHREALEMLEKFGKAKEDIHVSEEFRGPERTVRYLQQLPFEMIDLILQYAEWPIHQTPELGLQIFIADTENAESLPREKVLKFLDGVDTSLSLKYLEHVVRELEDRTPYFHDRLVELYVDKLRKLDDGHTDRDASDIRHWQEKVERFLQRSNEYSKTRILRDLPQEGVYTLSITAHRLLSRRSQILRVKSHCA